MRKILSGAKKILTSPLQLLKKKVKYSNKSSESKGILSSISHALKNKDIRNKFLFTLLIVGIFRLLSSIPLPGIDAAAFKDYFEDSPFNNIFTLVTAGRLDNPSIVAIGLAPYINASIIIQLLSTVIPQLEELQKEGGEAGKQKLNQYTRLLTLPLAMVQGFVIYTILKSQVGNLIAGVTPLEVGAMILSLAVGSILLMWLSELISENGIGNGSSIIITVGILSSLPGFISQDFANIGRDLGLLFKGQFEVLWSDNLIVIYGVILALLILLAGVVFMTEATRRITIQYARRVRGNSATAQSSFLPIKLNQAGVMPVIFASSLLILPSIISQFALSAAAPGTWIFNAATKIGESFINQPISFGYNAVDFILIVAFTFFYTFVVLNPNDTAENLKKSGGFVPGIRPGGSTAKYLTSVMIKLTLVGAIFLASLALAPALINILLQSGALTTAPSQFSLFSGIGGTSLLILVGVVLDTMRQLKSMGVARSYEVYKD